MASPGRVNRKQSAVISLLVSASLFNYNQLERGQCPIHSIVSYKQ